MGINIFVNKCLLYLCFHLVPSNLFLCLCVVANITGLGKIYGAEVKKNGVSFMKTEKLGVDFRIGNSRFKIKDLINGNNVLGK